MPLDVGSWDLAQAYVQYKSEDSVQRALEWHNTWQLWSNTNLAPFWCSAERVSICGMVPLGWHHWEGPILKAHGMHWSMALLAAGMMNGQTIRPLALPFIWGTHGSLCPAGMSCSTWGTRAATSQWRNMAKKPKAQTILFCLRFRLRVERDPKLWIFSWSFSCRFLVCF